MLKTILIAGMIANATPSIEDMLASAQRIQAQEMQDNEVTR